MDDTQSNKLNVSASAIISGTILISGMTSQMPPSTVITKTEEQLQGHQPEESKLQTGTSSESNNDDLLPPPVDFDSLPEKVKSTVRELWTAIDRSHSDSINAEKLIIGIARELDERGLCKKECISRKIKALLKDKIKAGKVTANWVHKCLPDEYKREYVGKVTSRRSHNRRWS